MTDQPKSRPLRETLLRLALALAIGTVGGAIFFTLHLPLPWMLGAMAACVIATLGSAPVAVPAPLRSTMSVIIGVLLGSSVSPDLLSGALGWLPSLAGVFAYVAIAGAIGVAYFRLVARFDLGTAYYSGMPGGLIEMVMQAESAGADTRRVALVHAARVMLVVFSVPFLVQVITGESFSRPAANVTRITDLSVDAWLWFLGTCLVGWILTRMVRVPAGAVMVPLAVSFIVHAAGWTDFKPPIELVIVAQVAIGAAVGCRFAGIKPAELVRMLVVSIGATFVLLAVTLAFVYAVSALSGTSPVQLLLAYSPGGLMEMGLVALAINMEIAFVLAHHLLRVLVVAMGAALIARTTGITRPSPAAD